MAQFSIQNTSSLQGKIAIVTGANIGLGYETTLALAKKGCTIVMACRNKRKAEDAKYDLLNKIPNADLDVILLDLCEPNSINQFSQQFISKYDQLDLLINNAGIMMPPYRKTSAGFESQMAANYFGHFLLTGLLFDTLVLTPNARIVSLSSLAHNWGDIYFDDLHFEKRYDAKKAYGQSKLACLMFAYELDRKIKEKGLSIYSLAAHPGISNTNLGQHMPKAALALSRFISPLLLQSPKDGALPTLRAALDPKIKGGEYFGPDGFREFKGKPVKVSSNRISHDLEKGKKLWAISEEMTGIKYIF